jgi:hypothetical protein
MSSADLLSMAESVNDEASFAIFLKLLNKDRREALEKEKAETTSPYGPGHHGWENGSIEAFLDRAAAWSQDTHRRQAQFPRPANPWAACAVILYMGKIYE